MKKKRLLLAGALAIYVIMIGAAYFGAMKEKAQDVSDVEPVSYTHLARGRSLYGRH